MHLTTTFVLLVSFILLGVHAELIAVLQIFRHGQRTPVSFFPNDPYYDSSYWGGLASGALTNEGKRMQMKLGQYTRSRYSNFIPKKYDPSFFYAQTTDVDRTHMSAQSNIYGLFPISTSDQKWQNKIDWQPIPIHPSDSAVLSTSIFPANCPAYTKTLAAVIGSEEFTKLDSENVELYKYLTNNSGSSVTDIISINGIWDPLKAEDSIGFSLPAWTKSVYPEPLRTMAGKLFELFTHTTTMKRLCIGPFINEVVTYLESMAADSSSSYKYKMYSAHDTNIAAILNTFGAFSPSFPPAFASTIYIELHKENWQNVVKVFNKDGDTLKQISVNGCELSCPLSSFRQALSDIIVDADTRDAECSSTEETKVLLGSSGTTGNKYSAAELEEKFAGVMT
ncbi:prostatic acid phosphatase [Diabrotica virgifera virgifera]|uniref:acid phosphatase n=1 Tax=Diabrotica virgifera virgifera TaxID=50390 RepID=A0ABM5ILI6_DIAVI|nr:prostatic acid phosphatase [Diabrotica virgifera virgifera]